MFEIVRQDLGRRRIGNRVATVASEASSINAPEPDSRLAAL
jgi:hypothetical protein